MLTWGKIWWGGPLGLGANPVFGLQIHIHKQRKIILSARIMMSCTGNLHCDSADAAAAAAGAKTAAVV